MHNISVKNVWIFAKNVADHFDVFTVEDSDEKKLTKSGVIHWGYTFVILSGPTNLYFSHWRTMFNC